ncbi:hypothetical protein MPSEU_000197500 [Mayamaea pseudoterrestris]|nr:hypothetical protein MPSEU_000197500 [Mayamaea pseudoterrestris]
MTSMSIRKAWPLCAAVLVVLGSAGTSAERPRQLRRLKGPSTEAFLTTEGLPSSEPIPQGKDKDAKGATKEPVEVVTEEQILNDDGLTIAPTAKVTKGAPLSEPPVITPVTNAPTIEPVKVATNTAPPVIVPVIPESTSGPTRMQTSSIATEVPTVGGGFAEAGTIDEPALTVPDETAMPSMAKTQAPTAVPTATPSDAPIFVPDETAMPSMAKTQAPTAGPTATPSDAPAIVPEQNDTAEVAATIAPIPTQAPSMPSKVAISDAPSLVPSSNGVNNTEAPLDTAAPIDTLAPTPLLNASSSSMTNDTLAPVDTAAPIDTIAPSSFVNASSSAGGMNDTMAPIDTEAPVGSLVPTATPKFEQTAETRDVTVDIPDAPVAAPTKAPVAVYTRPPVQMSNENEEVFAKDSETSRALHRGTALVVSTVACLSLIGSVL